MFSLWKAQLPVRSNDTCNTVGEHLVDTVVISSLQLFIKDSSAALASDSVSIQYDAWV